MTSSNTVSESPSNLNISTPRLSRRDALRAAGGAGAAALLASGEQPTAAQDSTPAPAVPAIITIPDSGAELPTDEVTFRWIDSGDQKAFFFREHFFPAYQAAHPNITIQYDGLPWNEIARVVPLGVRSGNAHDVFQLPLNISEGQAVREGWIAALDDIVPNFQEWKAGFPPGAFLPGITDFDGKTYALPTATRKVTDTLFYNLEYLERAGYDLASTPLTWDEFRTAARVVTEQGQGNYFGLILEGGQTSAWETHVSNLARIGGAAAGDSDIDWRTGEYVYTSDQCLAAIELLLALRDDGSVFPGSLSLNAPQARDQMPEGVAGMILQGPVNIPQWQRVNPNFAFGVASQPIPARDAPALLTYDPGMRAPFSVYAESPHQAVAGDILHYLGTLEGQTAWGAFVGLSEPPIFPEALQALATDPLTRKALELYDQQLRLGPEPRVRNPDTEMVYLEMTTLTPDFGTTIQGIYTGQLSDPRAAMQDLQDRSEAELERAIAAAQANGAQVSRDDWVFPNWDPTRDYTEADYSAL